MLQKKEDSVFGDARFWLALLFFGALISFLIITYPV
jgi:hypothetical protein